MGIFHLQYMLNTKNSPTTCVVSDYVFAVCSKKELSVVRRIMVECEVLIKDPREFFIRYTT